MIQAVEWHSDHLIIIDQSKLPQQTVFCDLYSIKEVYAAIKDLRVRGAPLIGITAAYGLYLGMRDVQASTPNEFNNILEEKINYLSSARPTAVNLNWALRKVQKQLREAGDGEISKMKKRLLKFARDLHDDDRRRCEGIANHGQTILPQRARILTYCNTGILATGGIGTALGIIYKAVQLGRNVEVYVSETRPVLQGARLTVWELHAADIPVTLICDNMAAWLMKQRKVDLVIVGADRIAANGATANKIGTYALAVLANFHHIPFYVAAPLSTFDVSLSRGEEIPIEMRSCQEVCSVFNQFQITIPDVSCWSPAFDVTPPDLIRGFITEAGIVTPPYKTNLKRLYNSQLN